MQSGTLHPETIVNGNDKRQTIHQINRKMHPIISNTGRVVSRYNFTHPHTKQTYKTQTVATGTVLQSELLSPTRGLSLILTCTHSIKIFIYECTTCQQYTFDKVEHQCSGPNFEGGGILVSASEIYFERPCLVSATESGALYGDTLETYKCEANSRLTMVDPEYYSYPYVTSGFDYAIIISRSIKMAFFYICCPSFVLGQTEDAIKKYKDGGWHIWGYPDDKRNVNDNSILVGMTAGQEGECSIETCASSGRQYLQQTKVDTNGGQSGAALWCVLNDDTVLIFGVHTGTYKANDERDTRIYNVANVFNLDKIAKIKNFMEQMTFLESNGARQFINWSISSPPPILISPPPSASPISPTTSPSQISPPISASPIGSIGSNMYYQPQFNQQNGYNNFNYVQPSFPQFNPPHMSFNPPFMHTPNKNNNYKPPFIHTSNNNNNYSFMINNLEIPLYHNNYNNRMEHINSPSTNNSHPTDIKTPSQLESAPTTHNTNTMGNMSMESNPLAPHNMPPFLSQPSVQVQNSGLSSNGKYNNRYNNSYNSHMDNRSMHPPFQRNIAQTRAKTTRKKVSKARTKASTKITCPYDGCNYSGTQSKVDTHVRTHTKEKPYKCDVCSRQFSQSGNMKTHRKTHFRNEKQFKCTLCGKGLTSKRALNNHVNRHAYC